jgi:hypothetical protein
MPIRGPHRSVVWRGRLFPDYCRQALGVLGIVVPEHQYSDDFPP